MSIRDISYLKVDFYVIEQEQEYDTHFSISAGAFVLANIWAMTHDENVYSEPFAFKPERYLDANGKLNDDGRVLAYGFGRR